jgi:6-pyruvoyltetrahydropterin/6-carboxytetrahydropterin synthase
MSFEITIRCDFSASHQLRLYDGSLEPLHGHNWRVEVTVAADKLDQIGVVMDFHELQRIVDEIILPMQNCHLNNTSAFAKLNPSAENVALHIAQSLANRVKVQSVQVWETHDCRAAWRA